MGKKRKGKASEKLAGREKAKGRPFSPQFRPVLFFSRSRFLIERTRLSRNLEQVRPIKDLC